MKRSIAIRVLVISFLLLALPLIVDSFIFFQSSYKHSIHVAKEKLQEETLFRAFALTELQPVKDVLLQELSYFLNLPHQLEHLDKNLLDRQLIEAAQVAGHVDIFLINPGIQSGDHSVIASSNPTLLPDKLISYSVLPRIVSEGRGSFIRYIYIPGKKEYILHSFVANTILSKEKHTPLAILVVATGIAEQLKTTVLDLENGDRDLSFAILSQDGIVFAANDPKLEGNYFSPISSTRKEQILKSGQLGGVTLAPEPLPTSQENEYPFFEFFFENQVQIAYRSEVPEIGLSLIAYAPKEAYFSQAVKHFLFIYLTYGGILIIGGGIAYGLSQWISRPLRQLRQCMQQVREGHLDVRFHEEPLGFEINLLGKMFNHTVDTLLENIQHAQEEKIKKETYQRELTIGRDVQRSLLPEKLPQVSGADLTGAYLPAEDVGGDFYLGLLKNPGTPQEEVLFVVADVSGKGVPSCLYALSARSLLLAHATLYEDLGEILNKTNTEFLKDTGETGAFVTLVFGKYCPQTKQLTYVSCGHPHFMLRRAQGDVQMLAPTGVVLGLQETSHYEAATCTLESGDMVLVYTKGMTEAINVQGESFSVARIKAALQNRKWETSEEVVSGIVEEWKAFTELRSQVDEGILVALHII